MKTFLWTTLFRIVALIAFLVVSGFGNIVNPVFDQSYLTKVLPASVSAKIEESAVNNFKTSPELCTEAENVCIFQTENTPEQTQEIENTEETTNSTETQKPTISNEIEQVLQWQSVLSQQLNDQFNQLMQQINTMKMSCSSDDTITETVDVNAQKKAELQAQIESLQNEMQGL